MQRPIGGYEIRTAPHVSDRGPERGGPKDDELVAELRSSVALLLSVAAILVLIIFILEISLS